MPKHFDVVHNSPEWDYLRLGIPTSSEFSKVITATGKLSAQSEGLENSLIAELMIGKSVREISQTFWIQRGHELEPEARSSYQLITDNEVSHGGFIMDDKLRFGCSPDGLIKSKNIGLEIKCPAPQTHIDYLINGKFDKTYKQQYQGQMLIAQLDGVDFFSYHPDLPPVLIHIEPDLEFQKTMMEGLETLHENKLKKIEILRSNNHIVPDKEFKQKPVDLLMAG